MVRNILIYVSDEVITFTKVSGRQMFSTPIASVNRGAISLSIKCVI